jgi:cation diffusion facilitator CzcD-associated flavoprotein CzcO
MGSGKVEVKRIFCAIVGAGMCGVTLADKLLSTGTLKQDEFVIFDRNMDFGGVWESNKYPGAACDIPSHAYVVRAFLNPGTMPQLPPAYLDGSQNYFHHAGWTKKFSDGKEIQQYYAKFAARRKLAKNTLFQTTVHEARWNEETLLWEIKIENQVTGIKTKWIANVLFDNGGGFHRPKYAAIPGRDTFKGEQWHTGQWRTDIDLTGKRVAIIGTGPSAAQVGPKIQPIVEKLHMYQRSCGHVLPRNNHVIPIWKKLLFSCLYPVLWLYHVSWVVVVSAALPHKTGLLEPSLTCLQFDRDRQMWMSGADKNQAMHEACIQFLEREVKDPIIREKLCPTTEFGCKRVLYLDDWYSMFNQPNVELVTEKPIRITERGIVSKTPHALSAKDLAGQPVGAYEQKSKEPDVEEVEREIDVLIWGTGFDMNDSGGHFQIYGKGGINLSHTWRDYPETYRSMRSAMFLSHPRFSVLITKHNRCRRYELSEPVPDTRAEFD